MALDGKVKVPGLGEVNKKTAVIVGVGVAGAGGIIYWRMRKNDAAASAAATTQSTDTGMVTDPAGNQCAQVDPVSGYCPGTTEDEQAQEQAAYGTDVGEGYDDTGGAGGYNYGGNGAGLYTDPNGAVCVTPDADGYCPQTTGGGGSGSVTAVTTNSQWLAEVEATFPTYTTAIAKVLGGVTVTTAEKNQFLEAVGVYGAPPQGYPTIHTSDTSGQPTSTAKVKVPNVVGKRKETGQLELSEAGFKVNVDPAVKPKVGYTIASQNPNGGSQAAKGSTVTIHVKETK